MKLVIVGAGGRLGTALAREYREKFSVIGFDHAQLDLANADELREKLCTIDFDLLINAAAFANVDLCEKERDQAFRINADAPRILAEICRDKNAKLIHFSTDYVFDGGKREPYIENDPANPIRLPQFFEVDVEGGILHFANAGECSWQEYAQWALDCCATEGIALKAKIVDALKLADMKNWSARRPVYSVLSTAKYSVLTDVSSRAWRDAVADYIRRFYSHK